MNGSVGTSQLLIQAHRAGASDVHLSIGRPPIVRVSGDLQPLSLPPLDEETLHGILRPMLSQEQWAQAMATGDLDAAYQLEGVSRFRLNLFRMRRGLGAVLRCIPETVLPLEGLGMPKAVRNLAQLDGGLVLVTGPTGSGKSTTMAALVNEVNATRPLHIITIEDPVEFLHESQRSLVSQREVGRDARTFDEAVRAAAREDPDLIVVGELRDRETIQAALDAAAAGTLVMGTLHTNSATKAVDRLIGVFPSEQRPGIRTTLAMVLRGVVAQRLMKVDDGRRAAVELMLGSPALGRMIRDGNTHQIPGYIAAGRRRGMVTMADSLVALGFAPDD